MALPSSAIGRLLERPEGARRIGPFTLVELLGRGGFAPVWLAREMYGATELRTAAVKLFALEPEARLGEHGRGAQPGSRIVEEARALCRVEHPNVVRFYALPIDEGGEVLGLAMEHVAGTSLDRRIARGGRLSVADTVALGAAVASALSAVHRAGLVHRDVKPANIIEAGGVYKLIDFGIAAAEPGSGAGPGAESHLLDDAPIEASAVSAGSAGSGLDRSARSTSGANGDATLPVAARSGTVGYIDPVVVARGVPATPASDLYALGAMLFECLTGAPPAAAGALPGAGLRAEVLDGREPAASLHALRPDVPPSLADLVDALLMPDRRDRPRSAEWASRVLERVRTELAGQARALPPEAVGPFRGLGRFEEGDRDVYFGRTSEIAASLEILRTRGVLALIGPSGSGKSSLARAGILPAVSGGALGGWPERWDTATLAPGVDPRAALRAALATFVPEARSLDPDELVVELAERAQITGRGVLVLVDQLEELATASAAESSAWAVELLSRIGDQPLPGLRAVIAARRDLLDPLLASGDLGKIIARGMVLIEPLRDVAWGDVLDQALASYGYALEDDALRAELTRQLHGAAGAMPLVQFALTELWQERDTATRKVTRAALDALGGIAGALERHADRTLAALTTTRPAAPEIARAVLLGLTTAQGTRVTRPIDDLRREIGPACDAIVEAFEQARLVVHGADGVALTHEALLSQWGKLRTWVAEAREDRLLAEELERDAAQWRVEPDAVPLWPRRRLAFAEELVRRGVPRLSSAATAFLGASRAAARRSRWIAATAGAAVLLSAGGAGLSYVRALRAERAQAENALLKEQETTRIVQEKQDRIDALLRELDDSARKEQLVALQREIKQAQGVEPPEGDRSSKGAVRRAPPPAAPPPAAPSPAPPTPEPTAPPQPDPASISMKVKRTP